MFIRIICILNLGPGNGAANGCRWRSWIYFSVEHAIVLNHSNVHDAPILKRSSPIRNHALKGLKPESEGKPGKFQFFPCLWSFARPQLILASFFSVPLQADCASLSIPGQTANTLAVR